VSGSIAGVRTVRIRHGLAARAAAGFALITTTAVAGQHWWLLPLYLLPLLAIAYTVRAGVDADDGGLTVRALVGRRRVEWAEVDALFVRRGRSYVRLVGGRELALPAVGAGDLPRLAGVEPTSARDQGQEGAG
jgi:hypothetical protein